jgi:predicted DNA-binding transcriptional regulator AlpA
MPIAQVSQLLYSYPEAAALLGMTENALRALVYRHQGPPITRVGKRRVRFAHSDLLQWIDEHRVPAAIAPVHVDREAAGATQPKRTVRRRRSKNDGRALPSEIMDIEEYIEILRAREDNPQPHEANDKHDT